MGGLPLLGAFLFIGSDTVSNYVQIMKESLGRHIEAPLADYLTNLGERRGSDWLIYNPLRMRMYHRYAARDAAPVIGAIEAVLADLHSYADVGCGSGAFAAEAKRRGHPITGYERSGFGRWLARRQDVNCVPFDLRQELSAVTAARADLAYSFEVAEHLPPPLGDRLVHFLTLIAPVVVFTAAQPGQGGSGHVNEQPREYWARRFAVHDFVELSDVTRTLSAEFLERGVQGAWFARNVAVYAVHT